MTKKLSVLTLCPAEWPRPPLRAASASLFLASAANRSARLSTVVARAEKNASGMTWARRR